MQDPSKPWKWDVDILSSPQYESLGNNHVYCDEGDRLWLPVWICFDESQSEDAFTALETVVVLLSEDGGVTWQITDRPSPAPSRTRVVLTDGTMTEMGGRGWTRYPPTEVERLEAEGYYVWDLGEKQGYCAVLDGAIVKVSRDGGQIWEERSIGDQLPFFAHFVARGPLRLLDDGTLIFLAYGYGVEDRHPEKQEGLRSSYNSGRSSTYILRSTDNGTTWDLVLMADGRHSCSSAGFTETFPIIQGDGNIFVMLRTTLGEPAFSVWSPDGGRSWSEPVQTPIRGKHPIPTALRDGTVVCSYPRRFAQPYGVRARFTSDMGKTWSEEVVIRDDIPAPSKGGRVAEPNTVELSDGTLFTAFGAKKYDDEGREWYFVGGSRWTRSYRGPYGPKLEVPPPGEKYNFPKEA